VRHPVAHAAGGDEGNRLSVVTSLSSFRHSAAGVTALSADPAPRRRLPLLLGLAAMLAAAVYATRSRDDAASMPAPVAASTAPAVPAPIPAPIPASASAALPPPASITPQRGNIPGLSVNATFATRTGGGSVLVTRPDGTRALVAVGTDAVPGIRLRAVRADRATFTAGGTQFWLPILSESAAKADTSPATRIAAAPPPPVPSAATPTESQIRESQAYQAALAPGQDGAWRGYAVRSMPPLFAKAGLKAGDIITGINGRAFDRPAEIAQLAREAALSSTIVFQVRRNGKMQELRVEP
jgi:hypothetical protein